MKTARFHSAPEILESRIAPATFFVSGSALHSLEIKTLLDAAATLDGTSSTAAHATAALLLNSGDTLYFNPDGVVATHGDDYKWVNVTGGKALVFLTDINTDNKYSLTELTGLAVSDKFAGSVFGDVNGSVATMLDGTGKFTADTLQFAAISSLKISGALRSSTDGRANILAGSGISHLTVGNTYFATPDGISVDGKVATGTAAKGIDTSFNGGALFNTTTSFSPTAGAAGGNITNAKFTGGVRGIFTGDGQNNANGDGGAGGTINSLTVANSPFMVGIGAGGGGDATGAAKGNGGAGGSLIGVGLQFATTASDAVSIETGYGGDSQVGNGGPSGSIISSSIRGAGPADSVFIRCDIGGDGGKAGGKGNGGTGGSIVNSSFTFTGSVANGFDLRGGAGGDAQGSGNGGAGGSWDWFFTQKNPRLLNAISGGTNAAVNAQAVGFFAIDGGDAGRSLAGTGGVGGAVLGGNFNFFGPVTGHFYVEGGDGGFSNGKSGDGGRVQSAVFTCYDTVTIQAQDSITVRGGTAGGFDHDAQTGKTAGNGGDIRQLILDFRAEVNAADGILISGNDGGFGNNTGAGGNGGTVNGVAVLATHAITGNVTLQGGEGGEAKQGDSPGGDGGSVLNFLVQAPKIVGALTIKSGAGGNGHDTGAGGDAGEISAGLSRTVFTPSPLTDAALATQLRTPGGVYVTGAVDSVDFTLGHGGNGGGNATAGGSGGAGGSFFDSKVFVGSVVNSLQVTGGGGGNAHGPGAGGESGTIDPIYMNVNGDIGGSLVIALDPGGVADRAGKNGAGRNYDDLSIVVAGSIGQEVSIVAPSGGFSTATVGGAGGSLNNLHLDIGDVLGIPNQAVIGLENGSVQVAGYDVVIVAGTGSGGDKGGAAGSIDNATVTTGALAAGALVHAGDGGGSTKGAGVPGGIIIDSTFVFRDTIDGALTIYGGEGGSGASGAAGGAGGRIESAAVTMAAGTDVSITAGNAGPSHGGSGPAGGAIDDLTFENTGAVNDVVIRGGMGSGVDFGSGKGGAGGNVSGSTVINAGGMSTFEVTAGTGGSHSGGAQFSKGDGGPGGALTGFTMENTAPTSASFNGGAGGIVLIAGTDPTGNGGAGGAVSGLTINDSVDATFHVTSGAGGDAEGKTSKGGNAGAVTGTELNTLGDVTVSGGMGGSVASGSGAGASGGAGGGVIGVTGNVGHLSVLGGLGGSALGGKGGLGGNVDTIDLTDVAKFARLIAAGNGGNGATSGSGGSVSKITVPGDIGDFTAKFGFGDTEMGGLIAGQAGTGSGGINGSISNVTASRIAAILAGQPAAGAIDVVGQSNAVFSLKSVIAEIIGADTGLTGTGNETSLRGFGTFTFIDNDANMIFSAGDTAIDGLVIVRSSSAPLSVTPLKLISV